MGVTPELENEEKIYYESRVTRDRMTSISIKTRCTRIDYLKKEIINLVMHKGRREHCHQETMMPGPSSDVQETEGL